MIIPAFFIFHPYGTLEIRGIGVAINILSLAGHFSGVLPTIYYEQSKTIFKTFQKKVELHYCSKIYETHFQIRLSGKVFCRLLYLKTLSGISAPMKKRRERRPRRPSTRLNESMS
jgi:hypothetical protein